VTISAPSETGSAFLGTVSGDFSPALMMEVELTEPLPAIHGDPQHRRAWILCRLGTEPVGTCIVPLSSDRLTPDQLGEQLWPNVQEAVNLRFMQAGLPVPSRLPGSGIEIEPSSWPYLLRRTEILSGAPFISVVVCTRDRAERLGNCLSYLDGQEYPRFEIVVVDNAPSSDATRSVIDSRSDAGEDGRPAVPCRYVREQRAGLSWARNAGAAAATGDVIAFVDDDERPDRYWLAEIARGFGRSADVGCVSGMILPARLDTPFQEMFEVAGGHSKGRGFTADIFSKDGSQSPLYPNPPFGAGGNMAFHREPLNRIRGFDVAMGAGTPTRGGEDSLALTLTLLCGYKIAYEPSAFVYHEHYQDLEGLGRQLHGYGIGLMSFYTALLRHRPTVLLELLHLLPAAINHLKKPKASSDALPWRLPDDLRRRYRKALLSGVFAYPRSVRVQSKLKLPEQKK